MPLRVAFFGTPGFAVPTLEHLANSPHQVVGVITQPDKPRGRGQKITEGPVKSLAMSLRVPVLQPAKLARDQFESDFASLNADIGVVAAYGKILPDWLLAAPRFGLINVHASLLPRYRGASPVHRAVINGDADTGVTIMRVVKALDAGPMLAAAIVPIGVDDTTTIVEAMLAVRGAELLVKALDAIEAGTARETPQDESLVTYAPKLAKTEGLVDWSLPAPRVHNLIRGLWPWPHAYTYLDQTRYILHRSRLSSRPTSNEVPGTIVHATPVDGLHVVCGDRTTLELVDLQLEGKRVMGAREAMTAKVLVSGATFSQP
ncbi:MAG TPA: methionyl-tRNA formyltransferase [Vicinamibacterales bacterium]|nr:methionyl-tRNA formyltransferase [Vicinamibacterales bacterium]